MSVAGTQERLVTQIMDLLQWVVDVEVLLDSEIPGLALVIITHTYPEGIDIMPWINRALRWSVPTGVKINVELKRVEPYVLDDRWVRET